MNKTQEKIYKRILKEDIEIETPDCNEGTAYFEIDGKRYSCHWSENWGICEDTIEGEDK